MWKEWRSSSEICHLLIFFRYCYLISYLKWSLKSFLQCYGSYIIFHLPTQSQWAESSGVLFGCFMSLMCAAHLSAPWHLASHSAKGRLNGLAKLKRPTCSVSTYTLGPGGQCPQEWLVAMCCRWPQCPDDVLFSKRRSHSHIIKMIIASKCCHKCICHT